MFTAQGAQMPIYQFRCKGTTKFASVQENGEKIAIFWTMDTREGYGTAFRLLEMRQYSYGNPSVILWITVGIYKELIGFLFKLGERQLDNKRQLMSI